MPIYGFMSHSQAQIPFASSDRDPPKFAQILLISNWFCWLSSCIILGELASSVTMTRHGKVFQCRTNQPTAPEQPPPPPPPLSGFCPLCLSHQRRVKPLLSPCPESKDTLNAPSAPAVAKPVGRPSSGRCGDSRGKVACLAHPPHTCNPEAFFPAAACFRTLPLPSAPGPASGKSGREPRAP